MNISRRVRDLTLDALDDLPAACRACVFWEVAGSGYGPPPGDPGPARAGKEAWWQASQLEWGPPGKGVYVEGRLVAYTTFGPARHFAGPRRRPAAGGSMGGLRPPAPSEDAVLLATMWVDPAYRGGGLAKVLLQAVLRETARRGGRAVEAIGRRLEGPGVPDTCVVAEAFLLACGFTVHREHPTHPLLRLDLRRTVRWQESVGHALEGVLERLARRERAPAPANR